MSPRAASANSVVVAWARAYCAVVTSRLLRLAVDARDPARLARFWAGLLSRDVIEDAFGALVPGEETQLGLRFVPNPAEQAGLSRAHLHLTSRSPDDQRHTVEAALGLGARHLDVGQRPEEGHIVLADPEDNAFCVIEPGNAFLAGCGFLGELACDGTRAVGLFWSQALGWPLVWDQNQETAVQSPHRGTKIAWGGEPAPGKAVRNRHRFELAPVDGDQAAEAERLLSLGAARLGSGDRGQDATLAMADPDGNEFRLLAV